MSRNGPTWVRPGVVDEGIDPPENVDDLGDELLDLGPDADVRANASASTPNSRARSTVRRAPSSESR